MKMRVVPIECLTDNYAYLLIDRQQRAVVIDPSEPAPVVAALQREGAQLTEIWLTHHHYDHVGGVEALCDSHPGIPVYGSGYDAEQQRIPRQTKSLSDGDTLSFDGGVVNVLEIPGHTLGALAYRAGACLFTGDTLFLGGCGRVFEGTLPQMQQSLAKLRALDPSLLVYPGHEYTVGNLTFGASVEPGNVRIAERLAEAKATRARNEPTVPGRLHDELETNVFLRWDAPEVMAYANAAQDAAAVFGAVRTAKDRY